ncbi:hypothetical protein KFZ58_11135 [Virgibacillus sp. NKC19-16]|uniref:hypothetical protein n=1 Tax=Virgibacillus salidurans TaxID=2831673 RepID=UPI001F174B2E|nr:hypothetical protein [Virgibacillus sp. NKC19-16]UJL44977.1 hypothetical protein KFZ58_11135 [Virgibacillus sp. NKC19-16]
MEVLKKVLNSYTVYPLAIEEVTERLFRVSDGQREYALKMSLLSKESLVDFENVYHTAFSKNISTILPVYLTKNGNLYMEMDQTIFYLTPWIETPNTEKNSQLIEHLYKNMGTVHAKTKQTQSISTERLIHEFTTYKAFCEHTSKEFLAFVEQFEKNRFMSPFELLVCTHYRDLEFALKEITKRIEQLIDEQEEETTWNFSLCHGNLRFSHTLGGHVINWENAYYENAVMDLAAFFKQEVSHYDRPRVALMEQFSTYNHENELNQNEWHLLIIYLLNPTNYLKIVQQYVGDPSTDTMVNRVRKLQHAHRQLLFGLQFSSFVETEYETSILDDLES